MEPVLIKPEINWLHKSVHPLYRCHGLQQSWEDKSWSKCWPMPSTSPCCWITQPIQVTLITWLFLLCGEIVMEMMGRSIQAWSTLLWCDLSQFLGKRSEGPWHQGGVNWPTSKACRHRDRKCICKQSCMWTERSGWRAFVQFFFGHIL